MNNTNPNLDPSLVETSASELPRVSREQYDRLDDAGRQKVQLIEEELHVGKDMRETGQVEVSKHVVEEQVSVPVTLQHEEVVITRKPATGSEVVGNADFTDEVISVPLREEVAKVSKTAHVTEEIEIEKHTTQQQTSVGGTVRREELDVQGDTKHVHIEGDTNRNI